MCCIRTSQAKNLRMGLMGRGFLTDLIEGEHLSHELSAVVQGGSHAVVDLKRIVSEILRRK